MPRDGAIILGAVVQPDRQGGRMSMPVPSSAPGTAALGSALLSRNSRAIIPTMGRMTSAKANSASATRWVLTASRNSAFTRAKLLASTNAGANALGRSSRSYVGFWVTRRSGGVEQLEHHQLGGG